MPTVLLVRHGRTTANATGVLAGRTPGVELDEVGRRQAEEAGRRTAELPVRAIVSSPLQRCRQTAQALLAARPAPCPTATEKGLIEAGYGDWTGKALKDLAKEKLWKTVQTQPSAVRFPGGESMTEMSARAVDAVHRWNATLAAEHGEDALWVAVSHGDVIKAILADALGMHLDAFQRIMVDPASISVVSYTDARPYVLRMNSTSADLAALLAKPAKKTARSRRSPSADAAVGGGLGAGEAPA
ncbi:2,3-bisphosphoglycerate-dependent phosphoglycerate mutase [Friedmanniella endophytica]|uniref:2,3-bisphosphoglycerate-dependent phosphoglycerate mutase n=1 Tax=Microlunatus kandeliicorticis TaxID=1759536 RepID=A0A7W3P6U8_9ACTN|nr:histidine phosphatase family protein [Microlunatus kandeliicorticis]MBA8795312.1 2,3-bisphosphoglycerate-dependent phosphoglycerate mutase [Microlunatus kandeliicorticis]